LIKYITEILSHTGTHGHIKGSLAVNKTPSQLDDAERLTSSNATSARLEISPVSTLARDMCTRNDAMYLEADCKSIYAAPDKWREEVTRTTRRFLCNLPLASLERAKISVSARHDGSQQVLRSIQFSLAVQCLGIRE
jgi:hypothetical protein